MGMLKRWYRSGQKRLRAYQAGGWSAVAARRSSLLRQGDGAQRLRSLLTAVHPVKTQHELVRIGGSGDGAYLVPDDLDGVAGCFSPGVSTVADFELQLAERGVPCFLADASVERPPVHHPLFSFEKRFLGAEDHDSFMTLESWFARCATESGDYVLQMDIEGAEFDVLLATPESLLSRFRIIVIEFHHLDRLFDVLGFKLIEHVFRKLLRQFAVVHIHPNNCSQPVTIGEFSIPPVMEFTFLRRDRIARQTPETRFPHPLDVTNVPEKKDFVLPAGWYAGRGPD